MSPQEKVHRQAIFETDDFFEKQKAQLIKDMNSGLLSVDRSLTGEELAEWIYQHTRLRVEGYKAKTIVPQIDQEIRLKLGFLYHLAVAGLKRMIR